MQLYGVLLTNRMQKPFDISDALLRELHDSETRSAAFGRLLESCLTPLYWHARRLVVVHEDAEDVVQETLLRAYKGIDRFRGDGPALKAWLYRIATNRALSLLGRRRRSLLPPLDAVSRTLAGRVSEQAAPDSDELLVRFQQAVLRLPLKQRLVFNLRYYDEMPYAQIAGVLRQREKTLRVNYHLAVCNLKRQLTEQLP